MRNVSAPHVETYMDNKHLKHFLHYVTLICTVLACKPHLSKPEHIATFQLRLTQLSYHLSKLDQFPEDWAQWLDWLTHVAIGTLDLDLCVQLWLPESYIIKRSSNALLVSALLVAQCFSCRIGHSCSCFNSMDYTHILTWHLGTEYGWGIQIAGNKTLEYLGKTTLESLVTTSVY